MTRLPSIALARAIVPTIALLPGLPAAGRSCVADPEPTDAWRRELEDGRRHWALQRPVAPPLPPVNDTGLSRGDSDRFLLARMEKAGVRPVGDADRESLIRRLPFDLVGLPPTPEDVRDFVADPAPDAVERVVEVLCGPVEPRNIATTVSTIDSPLLDRAAQRSQVDLVQRLNASRLELDGGSSPDTERVIETYELAFRMQDEVPRVMDISHETRATLDRYGVGGDDTDAFGRQCLMARRLVEAGVRFVQVTHGNWDHHFNLGTALESTARQVDRPIAGLLADLAASASRTTPDTSFRRPSMIAFLRPLPLVILGCVLARPATAQPPVDLSPAEIMKRADIDGDGKVSRDEFIKSRTARLEENFTRMDTDGDGTLSREEFAAGMARMRECMQRGGPGPAGPGGPGRPDRGPAEGFRRPPQQE